MSTTLFDLLTPVTQPLLNSVSLGKAFQQHIARSNPVASLGWVLLVILLGVMIWGAVTLWERYRVNQIKNDVSHEGIFQELCTTHELSSAQKTVLWTLAKTVVPEYPALIFLDVNHLKTAATRRSPQQPEYQALLAKLFDQKVTAVAT